MDGRGALCLVMAEVASVVVRITNGRVNFMVHGTGSEGRRGAEGEENDFAS